MSTVATQSASPEVIDRAMQIAERVKGQQPPVERRLLNTLSLLPDGSPNPLSYLELALREQGKRKSFKKVERVEDWESLKSHVQQVVRMDFAGVPYKDIAKALGRTAQWVSQVANSPLAVRMKKALHKEANARVIETQHKLIELSAKAAETYEQVLDGAGGATISHKLHAADQVLDRVGLSKISRESGTDVAGPKLNPDSLAAMTERAKQASRELGLAVSTTINITNKDGSAEPPEVVVVTTEPPAEGV